jgi:hypothetical protein
MPVNYFNSSVFAAVLILPKQERAECIAENLRML